MLKTPPSTAEILSESQDQRRTWIQEGVLARAGTNGPIVEIRGTPYTDGSVGGSVTVWAVPGLPESEVDLPAAGLIRFELSHVARVVRHAHTLSCTLEGERSVD